MHTLRTLPKPVTQLFLEGHRHAHARSLPRLASPLPHQDRKLILHLFPPSTQARNSQAAPRRGNSLTPACSKINRKLVLPSSSQSL